MTEEVNLTLKICFLGDSSVGKTSLIKKYVYDIFDNSYLMTMGTKVTKKKVTINMPEEDKIFHLTFMIWDIIGDIHFRGLLHHSYFHGAGGALLVCDMTRPETMENLNNWMESLESESESNIPTVILGNKDDLEDQKKVTEEQLNQLADVYNSLWYLTSAKTGSNVEDAFRTLGMKMIKEFLHNPNFVESVC